jgi:hypothetical protein
MFLTNHPHLLCPKFLRFLKFLLNRLNLRYRL